jgi:hypothetical protein
MKWMKIVTKDIFIDLKDSPHTSCDGLSYEQQTNKDEYKLNILCKKIYENLGDINKPFIPEDVAILMNEELNKLASKHYLLSFKAYLADYLLGLGVLSHHKHRRTIIQSAISQARLAVPSTRKIMVEGNEFIIYINETDARCVGKDSEFNWTPGYNTELRDDYSLHERSVMPDVELRDE